MKKKKKKKRQKRCWKWRHMTSIIQHLRLGYEHPQDALYNEEHKIKGIVYFVFAGT